MPTFFGSSKTWKIDHSYDNYGVSLDGNEKLDTISTSSKGNEKDTSDNVSNETPQELKLRKRSHWIIYATVFVMSIGFSLALTGVWPYLQLLDPTLTKTALGWVIAANPLGQLIASPVVGYFGNKLGTIRVICYFTLTSFVVGNLIYSFLPAMTGFWSHSAFHIMIISRFIVGLSSSNLTLCRYYMTLSTTDGERTGCMAILSAAQALGFIIGPVIQTVLVLSINEELLKYRTGGWVAALFGVANIVLLTPYFFQEFNLANIKEKKVQENIAEGTGHIGGHVAASLDSSKPDMISVIGLLIAYFFSMLIFIFMETLSVPFLTDNYALENGTAVVVVGTFTLIMGVVSVGVVLVIRKVVLKFDERKILLYFGLIPITIGTFLYMPIYTDLPLVIANCTTIQIPTGMDLSYEDMDQFLDMNRGTSFNSNYLQVLTNSSQSSQGNCTPGCPEYQEWCFHVSKIPYAQLGVANLCVILGFPIMSALLIALYSKAVGNRPQGLWMALLAEILCVARVVGPIMASYVYTSFGTVISFGMQTVGMLVGMVSYIVIHRRLPSSPS